jgi:hypothetical protein
MWLTYASFLYLLSFGYQPTAAKRSFASSFIPLKIMNDE